MYCFECLPAVPRRCDVTCARDRLLTSLGGPMPVRMTMGWCRARTRRSASLANDLVGQGLRQAQSSNFGKLSRATSASSVEPFTLALSNDLVGPSFTLALLRQSRLSPNHAPRFRLRFRLLVIFVCFCADPNQTQNWTIEQICRKFAAPNVVAPRMRPRFGNTDVILVIRSVEGW